MRSQLAKLVFLLILVFALCGCAPVDSVFPLYKPDDASFEPKLIGKWQPVVTDANSEDKEVRWIFAQSSADKFYDFRWTAVGKKGAFVAKARLVQLGTTLFIDFEGDDSSQDPDKMETVAPYPVIPTHMLGRFWLEGDSLKIHFLSDDWVKNQIKAGTFTLAQVDSSNGPLLIASTDDLRKFMQAHAEDTEALSEKFEFTRVKDAK